MCDAHWLIDLVQSARTSILVKILLFQERESRSKELERHEKGRGFREWKLVVVGQDYYVHPNVENLSGPSNKEVV